MTEVLVDYRSVSQLKQYERCPFSYKLARIDRAWKRPAAWTSHGSAVHAAIEAWERSGRSLPLAEVEEVFKASYADHINADCEITPNFEWWFASGPYGGQRDIERRYDIGLEHVKKYIQWANDHPHEKVWTTPDGVPAIELEFDIDLDGVQVRGFIDLVLETQDEGLRVRDHKTGRHPGDDFQLGVYKVALEEMYGVTVLSGDYWMARSGKPTYPFNLEPWTREAVAAKFLELDENIRAGRFDPTPDPSVCTRCDVSYDCPFAVG